MNYYEQVVSNKALLKKFLSEINLELKEEEVIMSKKYDGAYIFCKRSIDLAINDFLNSIDFLLYGRKIDSTFKNLQNEYIVLLSDDYCIIDSLGYKEAIDASTIWLKFLHDNFESKRVNDKNSNIKQENKLFE